MAAQRIWLLTASPRDPATGNVVTVRLAGGGSLGFTQFGSTAWTAGLARPPVIAQSLGFDDAAFGQGSVVQALQLVWGGKDADAKALAALYWRDQPFTLHSGPDGGADAAMTLILSGRIADVTTGIGQLILQMADPSVDLNKPAVTATFAGTGGIEGDPELKGQAKWRGWGPLFNVGLRSLDKANNIWVCTDPALPVQEFDQVYDKGNAASSLTLVNWAGSIAATLAALIAASAPAGGAAIAPSISCLKWWFANPGRLTCDIRGEIGAGYIDRPADIAARIIAIAAGPAVDGAMLTAARTARNHEAGWLISDTGATIAAEVNALLSGVSLWFGLSAAGVIEMGEWAWGASVATLVPSRIERVATYQPVKQISIGWKRNHSVMARGDIAGVVLYGEVSGTPTTLAAVDAAAATTLTSNTTKLATVATGATRNNFYTGPSDPGGADGDYWRDTSTTPNTLKFKAAGSWIVTASNVNNTAQILDGANLGLTASWSGVAGSGKPADNATVGATLGVNATGFGNLAGLSAINPATAQLMTTGSIPPTVPDNQFTYTSTTTSITITWPAITVYRADGTTITTSSGSQAISGLSASSTFKVYPYIADGGGTTGSVSFVTGGSAGSPAILFSSAGSALAASTMAARGNIPLSGFLVATPAVGGGGGGGGGSNCLHPETEIREQSKGWIIADQLCGGDWVTSPNGWAQVRSLSRRLASRWIEVETDECCDVVVTEDHRFHRSSGGEVRARDIKLGDLLATGGDHAEVSALRLIQTPVHLVQIELADPHLYFLGRAVLLCHNPKP